MLTELLEQIKTAIEQENQKNLEILLSELKTFLEVALKGFCVVKNYLNEIRSHTKHISEQFEELKAFLSSDPKTHEELIVVFVTCLTTETLASSSIAHTAYHLAEELQKEADLAAAAAAVEPVPFISPFAAAPAALQPAADQPQRPASPEAPAADQPQRPASPADLAAAPAARPASQNVIDPNTRTINSCTIARRKRTALVIGCTVLGGVLAGLVAGAIIGGLAGGWGAIPGALIGACWGFKTALVMTGAIAAGAAATSAIAFAVSRPRASVIASKSASQNLNIEVKKVKYDDLIGF